MCSQDKSNGNVTEMLRRDAFHCSRPAALLMDSLTGSCRVVWESSVCACVVRVVVCLWDIELDEMKHSKVKKRTCEGKKESQRCVVT